MAVGLAILSFLCVAFLSVFISAQRVRTSVPRLAIILWLCGYNLVRGINMLVWAGNVEIYVPVWCDIGTNLMLGANLAIPAAFLCVSRQLELLSSMRTIPSHPTVVRNRLMFDIFMCYLLPIFYMLLHLVVQNHRFDLVENLGCSASVDPSVVGFSIMWIPPLVICSISVIFFALSIHNSSRHGVSHFSKHLESRSTTMTSSSFFRCLIISMATTIATGVVYLFCSFSGPALHPWSWTAVHASMSEVNIVSSQDDVTSIQLAWWGGLVVSILYLLLSFCLGEETRVIFQWIRKQATRERGFVLPIQLPKVTQPPWSKTQPLTVEYKSAWDDMLDVKGPKAKEKAGNSSSMRISTCSSPTPTISTVLTEDEAFMASTLSYLGSPTAKTLGLSGSPVPRRAFDISPRPRIPSPFSPIHLKTTDNPVPTPPTSPLPSLPNLCYMSRSQSHPPISCSEDTIANRTREPDSISKETRHDKPQYPELAKELKSGGHNRGK